MLDGDDTRPLSGVSQCFTDTRFARVHAGIIGGKGLLPRVIRRSAWYDRGWTFQEVYLSMRIIYMSSSGIALSCRQEVLEELPPEVDFAGNPKLSWVPLKRIWNPPEEAVGPAYPWDHNLRKKFRQTFAQCAGRSLTYESDVGVLSTDTFFDQEGPPRLLPQQCPHLQMEAILLPRTRNPFSKYCTGDHTVAVPTLNTRLLPCNGTGTSIIQILTTDSADKRKEHTLCSHGRAPRTCRSRMRTTISA